MIRENLEAITERIEKARKKSPYGQDVNLIAVSKTHPVSDIREAYALGVRDFGENKVQELCEKYDQLPSDIRWHLIGHLQRNKVKNVIGKAYLIHSVDSLRLAEEIERQAAKKDITVNILIEVNISHEESKFGIDKTEIMELVNAVNNMEHVNFRGLMTIAPFTDAPETTRYIFRELKNLSIDIKGANPDNNECVLSMGMSGDFEVAIEEGADFVRIGTSIFGERIYK